MNKLLTLNNQNGSSSGGSNVVSTTNTCMNSKCDCCKCTYCQNSLGSVSIKCSECFNFNLCLKCFSMSAEIGEHHKDHSYTLRSTINFPLFGSEKPWSYKEELLLIQFIEQYGFDNWEEIAKHIPPRSPEECMQHYHSYYIYGNLGKNTFNANNLKLESHTDTLSLISSSSSSNKLNQESSSQLATTVLLPPIEMSIEEQRALGYMPLRDDFEREYKNNAESLLSNLSIANNQHSLLSNLISTNSGPSTSTANNNLHKQTNSLVSGTTSAAVAASVASSSSYDYDDVLDLDFKLILIEMYRECLTERQRFKKIARDYGLLNNASALMNKFNNSISDVNNLNNGGGACSSSTAAMNSIKNNNLQNGFTFDRIFSFRKNQRERRGRRSNKEKELAELNEKLKKYAQFLPVSEYETFIENLRKQRQICKKIQELNYYRSEMGMTTLKEIEMYTQDKQDSNGHNGNRKRRKRRKKMSESMLADDSTPKRLTRRQYSNSMFTPIHGFHTLSLGLPYKRKNKKRINTTTTTTNNNKDTNATSDLNNEESNQSQNFSSESSDSMNNYELVENYENYDDEDDDDDDEEEEEEDDENKHNLNDLISEDENEDDEENEDVNVDDDNSTFESINQIKNKRNGNEDIFTDEDDDDDDEEEEGDEDNGNEEEDCSEDLSSGGAASSGGSGINDSNHELLCMNNGRRLRQLSNRRNISINDSFNLKQNGNKLKKHKSNKTISKLKKKRLQQERINGRSERLCSMPGYNLLSENEKKLISSLHLKPTDYMRYKTNLIKNSLVNRQNNRTKLSMSTSLCLTTSVLSNQANLEIQPPTGTSGLMMLRRHSTTNLNSNDENNMNGNNCLNLNNNNNNNNNNENTSSNATSTVLNSNNSQLIVNQNSATNASHLLKSYENNKNLTILMKSTCPDYYQIPRSTRKRILRFLCDNGWINI